MATRSIRDREEPSGKRRISRPDAVERAPQKTPKLHKTAKHMNTVLSWWIYLLVSNLVVILYTKHTHTHAVLNREDDILHATQPQR